MLKFNSKLIVIVLIATFFGLLSGIAGMVFSRVYLLEEVFNLPMFGDINLSNGVNNNSGLVIRDAKKIVIEQNDKVNETINNVHSGIVGIFKKNVKPATKKGDDTKKILNFNLDNYYNLKDEIGQGFVITSDGWIISSFIPESYENDLSSSTKDTFLKNYVIISNDNKIYSVKNIIIDPLARYAFWQILANDLPVKRFVNSDDVKNGQLVAATNWDGEVLVSSIMSKNVSNKEEEFVKSSDDLSVEIHLTNNIEKNFNSGFIFNLNNEIVALIDKNGKAELVSSLISCMNCIFKMDKIIYPKLGVNYIELSSLLESQKGTQNKGALIYPNKNGIAIIKGSAAELAGLKAGDIITKINNIEINIDSNLSSQINKYLVGDEILIEYTRNNKTATTKAVLK